MSRRSTAAAAAVLALSGPAAGEGSGGLQVPVGHWGYELIARLETTGALSGTGDGIKPLSRGAMARLAALADSAAAAGGVTAIDRQRIRRLLVELGHGRPPGESAGLEAGWPARSTPPLRYSTDRGEIFGDLLLRQQTDLLAGRGRDGTEGIYRNRVGGLVEGSLVDRIGFRIALEQTREQGSRRYLLRDDLFEPRREAVQLRDGFADYHEGGAYVAFSVGGFVEVQIGKDRAVWGPASLDNLGLGGNAPGFHMVRLRSTYGALHLVSLHGALRPCPDRPDSPLCAGTRDEGESYVVNGMSRRLDRERWIAAHRLEAAVTPSLDIGFQEVVVYGDRGIQAAYLNPITPYWAAQSYFGDKDNVMMALDADWRVRPGVRIWGAYMIDDLRKLKILSDDFTNKYSLQTGLAWADPLGLSDLDLEAEYVRIEPWIYTHKFPVNTFRHFDAPLGHSLGPNSDRWRFRLDRRWSAGWSTAAWVGRRRHGDNVLLADGEVRNVGGDMHYGWRPGDERETKSFLDGRLGRWTTLGGSTRWRAGPRLHLLFGAELEWGEDVPLPPRDGTATALVNRRYGDGRQQRLFLDLRYGHL